MRARAQGWAQRRHRGRRAQGVEHPDGGEVVRPVRLDGVGMVARPCSSWMGRRSVWWCSSLLGGVLPARWCVVVVRGVP